MAMRCVPCVSSLRCRSSGFVFPGCFGSALERRGLGDPALGVCVQARGSRRAVARGGAQHELLRALGQVHQTPARQLGLARRPLPAARRVRKRLARLGGSLQNAQNVLQTPQDANGNDHVRMASVGIRKACTTHTRAHTHARRSPCSGAFGRLAAELSLLARWPFGTPVHPPVQPPLPPSALEASPPPVFRCGRPLGPRAPPSFRGQPAAGRRLSSLRHAPARQIRGVRAPRPCCTSRATSISGDRPTDRAAAADLARREGATGGRPAPPGGAPRGPAGRAATAPRLGCPTRGGRPAAVETFGWHGGRRDSTVRSPAHAARASARPQERGTDLDRGRALKT